MAWVPRGYVTFSAACYRLLTLWRVSKLTGSGASSPPSRGNPIPICKVLTCTSIICAHVDRLSSELCVDWATLLSVSATLDRSKLEGTHGGEAGGAEEVCRGIAGTHPCARARE